MNELPKNPSPQFQRFGRLLLASLLVIPGLLMLYGAGVSLYTGSQQLPGGNSYRRLAHRFSSDVPELPAQTVDPGTARLYAGVVLVLGIVFVGLGVAAALGYLQRNDSAHVDPESRIDILFGSGLLVATALLAVVSSDVPGLGFLWILCGLGGLFRFWRGVLAKTSRSP